MAGQYTGTGQTVEEALKKAVDQIPIREHRDFATGRVVSWGVQRGGFIDAHVVYVVMEEDPNAPSRHFGKHRDDASETVHGDR